MADTTKYSCLRRSSLPSKNWREKEEKQAQLHEHDSTVFGIVIVLAGVKNARGRFSHKEDMLVYVVVGIEHARDVLRQVPVQHGLDVATDVNW